MNNTKTQVKLENELHQFIGTTQYYQLTPTFFLTDGGKYLVDNGYCWLVTFIMAHQIDTTIQKDAMLQQIQFWDLVVHEDKSATVTCSRDLGDVAFTEEIEFTDSILDSLTVYVQPLYLPYLHFNKARKVLFLPSEY